MKTVFITSKFDRLPATETSGDTGTTDTANRKSRGRIGVTIEQFVTPIEVLRFLLRTGFEIKTAARETESQNF